MRKRTEGRIPAVLQTCKTLESSHEQTGRIPNGIKNRITLNSKFEARRWIDVEMGERWRGLEGWSHGTSTFGLRRSRLLLRGMTGRRDANFAVWRPSDDRRVKPRIEIQRQWTSQVVGETDGTAAWNGSLKSARGLHVKHVPHIINWLLKPTNIYKHRTLNLPLIFFYQRVKIN